MTNVNKIQIEFECLPNDLYIKYLDKAEKVHSMGLHLDKDIVQLAALIYEKERSNES